MQTHLIHLSHLAHIPTLSPLSPFETEITQLLAERGKSPFDYRALLISERLTWEVLGFSSDGCFNIDAKDILFMLACCCLDYKFVKRLLFLGANPRFGGNSSSAIDRAISGVPITHILKRVIPEEHDRSTNLRKIVSALMKKGCTLSPDNIISVMTSDNLGTYQAFALALDILADRNKIAYEREQQTTQQTTPCDFGYYSRRLILLKFMLLVAKDEDRYLVLELFYRMYALIFWRHRENLLAFFEGYMLFSPMRDAIGRPLSVTMEILGFLKDAPLPSLFSILSDLVL